MKISTKYLKSLLSCYEYQFEKRQKMIRQRERESEVRDNLEPLYIEQAKLEGKILLCNWLIEMSEIPEEEE